MWFPRQGTGIIIPVSHSNKPSAYLRAAAAQLTSVPGDVSANAAAGAVSAKTAANGGADVVVYPELFLPGYHPPSLGDDRIATDIVVGEDKTVRDPRLDPLRHAAQLHHVALLVGASVLWRGDRYIATLAVDSRGSITDVYHKQNLCGDHERELFTYGDTSTSLIVNGWRLGLGICYDATFPEHARAAAVSGCHAYVSSGAFVAGGEHRCDLYHAARALDNTFYVVFSGAVAGSDPWAFGGGSAIYDPEGQVCDRISSAATGVAIADLEAERLERTRADHTMLADLRADLGERKTIDIA